jgi:hypothetical protein
MARRGVGSLLDDIVIPAIPPLWTLKSARCSSDSASDSARLAPQKRAMGPHRLWQRFSELLMLLR